MQFAEDEHIPIHQVGEVPVIWLFRWRAKTQATTSRQARDSQDAYRDKDGKQNWEEWSARNPGLSKLANWADMDDVDG